MIGCGGIELTLSNRPCVCQCVCVCLCLRVVVGGSVVGGVSGHTCPGGVRLRWRFCRLVSALFGLRGGFAIRCWLFLLLAPAPRWCCVCALGLVLVGGGGFAVRC